MKFLVSITVWLSTGALFAAENAAIIPPPLLQGMFGSANKITIFAVSEKGAIRTLHAVGERLGPYEVVGFSLEKGYVDFRRDGQMIRPWLPGSSVASKPAFVRIEIPEFLYEQADSVGKAQPMPPESRRKVMKDFFERRLNDPTVSLEVRQQRLEKLLADKHQITFVGQGNLTAADIPPELADRWSPERIAEVNRMSEVGKSFQNFPSTAEKK